MIFTKVLEKNELFSLVHIQILNTDDLFLILKIWSLDISKSAYVKQFFIFLARYKIAGLDDCCIDPFLRQSFFKQETLLLQNLMFILKDL